MDIDIKKLKSKLRLCFVGRPSPAVKYASILHEVVVLNEEALEHHNDDVKAQAISTISLIAEKVDLMETIETGWHHNKAQ